MADTQKTYTIGARDMFILRVHKCQEGNDDHESDFARASDPARIDGLLDEIEVTNPHERIWCKAVARRHLQQQAIQVAFVDYEEGRATWDAGDTEGGIPDSDEPGTGASPWE